MDILFGESPDVHHLLHLHRDAERWAPPSPVTRLAILQIKTLITVHIDETMLPEKNLCRRICETQQSNR